MTTAYNAGIINIATVPHRSPFRYPGGKTWLVPRVRDWLSSIGHQHELIEPFGGGAIIGLTAVFEDFVDRLLLVELDDDIASVWRTVLNGCGRKLAEHIVHFELTPQSVDVVLKTPPCTLYDRAFRTILRNRISRGGILAPGAGIVKNGENGRGLLSRWYPETISRRIVAISELQHRIDFVQTDGIQVMRDNAHREDVVFFIDPPYTVAGRRLYQHSEIDHADLFDAAASLRGDFLITYDNTEEIAGLARQHGFMMRTVPMKNTHHSHKLELLIGRDLGWVSDCAHCTGPNFRQNTLFEDF